MIRFMVNNKKGLAIAIVLFFAFVIGVTLAALIKASSNTYFQSKRTVYEMQTNYLVQSGIQLARLYIKLFPNEIYTFYKDSYIEKKNQEVTYSTFPLNNICDSYLMLQVGGPKPDESSRVATAKIKDFSLFGGKYDDHKDPYDYWFGVTEMRLKSSTGNRSNERKTSRGVADTYVIKVKGAVNIDCKDKKGSLGDKYCDKEVEEEFIVSRF